LGFDKTKIPVITTSKVACAEFNSEIVYLLYIGLTPSYNFKIFKNYSDTMTSKLVKGLFG